MQPLRYNLRNPAAKDKGITHAAMAPSNLDAAITMRFATSGCKPASLDAHGNTKRQQSCSRYTAICNQRVKKPKELRTYEQPLVAEHRENSRTRRTQGTFHRQPEQLYTEKHKVSCPGFLPKRSPCNIHAAITMRFATSGCKPASLDAHGNTKRQQSCSRYTAICNQRFKKRKELRTHEQSLVNHLLQTTEEEPIRARFERSRTRRTQEVSFIAGRSHFTRINTRFPAPAFSQNEAHATSMQPLHCVLQHQVANPHLSTHMATQNDNNHAAVTLRSASRESRNEKNYAHMNNHLSITCCRPQRRNRFALGSRTQATFHRRPEPLYTEKHTVSCPGFLP